MSISKDVTHTKYIKKYIWKYLSWLQGENRKLHKIFGDKNLTESVHKKISHGVRNSLVVSSGFAWCAKFRTAMRKCWLLDFFLWFSSLHLWLAWQRAMKCSKSWILHVFELQLALPLISKDSPSSWFVSMIKKLPKIPKLAKNLLVTLARFLSVPIELKGINYYSKVFKTVSFKL